MPQPGPLPAPRRNGARGAQRPRRLRLWLLAGLRGGRAHAYKRLIQANTPHILNELHLPVGASVGLGAAGLHLHRLTGSPVPPHPLRRSPPPGVGRPRRSPPRPTLDGTEHGGGGGSGLGRRRLSAPRAGAPGMAAGGQGPAEP